MLSLIALPLFTLASASPLNRRQTNYLANAEAGYHALINDYYNQSTGVFETIGWWNAANGLTAIGELASHDNSVVSQSTQIFDNSYYKAPTQNPQPLDQGNYDSADYIAWCDHCYDDNGWWTLAWIQAYDVTGDQRFLDLAQSIFDNNVNADSHSQQCGSNGGGVVWCDNNPYVNAIANELFLSEAAHLANRVSGNASAYLQIAEQQWAWFQQSNLINPQNLINDGLESNCTNTYQRSIWSYNQGVILQGLAELYKANNDNSVLSAANTLAQASIGYLCDSNNVVTEPACDPNCDGNQIQFKGIYIRGLSALAEVSPCDQYTSVIESSAQSIFNNDNDDNTFGLLWTGPASANGGPNAGTTGSALSGLVGPLAIGQ